MNYNTLKVGDIDTTLNKVIKDVIFTSNTFIVYMDEQNVIQWSAVGHTQFGNNFGKIQNQISYWESICNKLFKPNDANELKMLLAEAYARMLDEGNDASAQQIIDDAVERIKKEGGEILRLQYLVSSLITTAILILFLTIIVLVKNCLLNVMSYEIYKLLTAGLLGGIGAFMATMIRSYKYKADVTSSKSVHRLDGFLRIVYGMFAGVIIILGIKSNIFLGFIKDSSNNRFLEILICLIGGSSEIILPNIIKKIEKNTK